MDTRDTKNPLRNDLDVDVVVAGASIAGCTTAIMLGRAGLRVALVERRRRMDAHKTLCGHWILGGAQPTLRRLGLWQEMLDHGAVSVDSDVWTPQGWIGGSPGDEVPWAIGMRRRVLDPLLRRIAADTPGVRLLLGHTVTGLAGADGGAATVTLTTPDGAAVNARATVVVGADGARSRVAELAGAVADVAPNERCFLWAYYRGIPLGPRDTARIWNLDPDVVVAVPAGDELMLLGAFVAKDQWPALRADGSRGLEALFRGLADPPDLSQAVLVEGPVGTLDVPLVRRDATPMPGVALVGDAAMVGDPLPAVGCGWAFRSAEWLADALTPALLALDRGAVRTDAGPASAVEDALAEYRCARQVAEAHDDIGRLRALGAPAAPPEVAIRAAAVQDADIARRMRLFAMRAAPPDILLNPDVMARVAGLQPA